VTAPEVTAPEVTAAGLRDGRSPPPPVHAIHHLEEVMGTIVVVDVYTEAGYSGFDLTEGLAAATAELHRADQVFSTWLPDSAISRLRRGEMTEAEAPPEVAEVLTQCTAIRELTKGWFDPWAMPGGVDPTGYVKGWAAQRALRELQADGVCGAIVNAAGDVASSGGMGPGIPFRIGIADPLRPQQLAAIIELTGAVATSGCYERGPHLIDPFTGRPAARVASASVTGPDLALADTLATALAVAGEPGLDWIEPIEGYEALVIAADGTQRYTPGFPFAPA
jgi:FAD:protein FMN transferase